MSRHTRKRSRRTRPGAAPGSLFIDPRAPKPVVQLIAYGAEEGVTEKGIHDVNELKQYLHRWPVCWVNVDGLGDEALLRNLQKIFHLHPLALEDVVNVHQRAKVEQYDQQTFIVTHMMSRTDKGLESEQFSIFLGPGFVLTFQELPGGDCLDPVRERIRQGHLREREEDYLTYALLDAVIDYYFPILESYGEHLEAIEDRIIMAPQPTAISEIHGVKRELLHLRRTIWPQREALNSLIRDKIPMITDETRLYLRDCYDHSVRLIDLIETDREVCSDLMDLYLSSTGNRMNEIMKILTIISTIFIPLTFIAGVYGMNFRHMPELEVWWAYPATWLLMIAIAIGMLIFFARRGWIGRRMDVIPQDAAERPR